MATKTAKAIRPKSLVHSDPEIMGGVPVFVGTRVPVKTLFDYLEDETLEVFLDHFPSVNRRQAIDALRLSRDLVLAHAYSAR